MELGVHCDIFDMAGTPFLVHSGVQESGSCTHCAASRGSNIKKL